MESMETKLGAKMMKALEKRFNKVKHIFLNSKFRIIAQGNT
jgi:hypothetical protein